VAWHEQWCRDAPLRRHAAEPLQPRGPSRPAEAPASCHDSSSSTTSSSTSMAVAPAFTFAVLADVQYADKVRARPVCPEAPGHGKECFSARPRRAALPHLPPTSGRLPLESGRLAREQHMLLLD
jgi:hypothetical protein